MTLQARLVLLAAGLVVGTAAGVGGMLTWSALADIEAAQRTRGLAVARDFAHRAAPAARRGDRRALQDLVASGFEVHDLARIEIRNALGRAIASRDFDTEPSALKPTARAITGPPDADGIRDVIGMVVITLSAASMAEQRRRYLSRAAWVTGGVAVIGLSLAIGLGLRLARPLQQVADAADAAAEGEYADADALPKAGPVEIVRLSDAFRGAVSAIAERETSLRQVNADLQRTQAARDAMTHMLVHDLKGPLGNVVTLLGILETAALDEDDLELVVEGRARCVGLLGLIGDLLDIGRLEYGQHTVSRQPIRAATLLDDTIASVQRLAADRGFAITRELPDPALSFEGDARLLQRVLTNLLVNAIRHGAPPVVIRAEPGVRLSVRDGGSGPPADQIDTIFETWASGAGGKRRGSGLGLAFVKLAVEAHHGAVRVDGSRFEVHLPGVA